jgi:hypothetical protein
MTDVPSL